MKTLPESDDPLLQSLVEEVKDLPKSAAAHARSRQQARTTIARVSVVLTVMLFAAGMLLFGHTPERKDAGKVTRITRPPQTATSRARQGYVKVYHEGETAADESIPPNATERERQLLAELPGVPLLIVKNDAGEVTRVHIFER
jgi:hypothetical protein